MSQKEQVIVVVPVYRQQPSHNERIAFLQCLRVLQEHPIALITPTGLDPGYYRELCPSIRVIRFSPEYFKSTEGYSGLLLSRKFYKKFECYDYLLLYQLDAFVFRDDLNYWCGQGYDYIGAPWFEGFTQAAINAPFLGVGNGGLSLRCPTACLRALSIFSWIQQPVDLWKAQDGVPTLRRAIFIVLLLIRLMVTDNTFHMISKYQITEDRFWGKYVNRTFAWFKVPPPEVALQFSFEVNAQQLYDLNGKALPFGCHGWSRYAIDFWKPHIERFGYQIEQY